MRKWNFKAKKMPSPGHLPDVGLGQYLMEEVTEKKGVSMASLLERTRHSTVDLTSAPYTDHVRYLSYTVPPERDQVEVGTLLRRSLGLSAGLIKRVKWLTDGITLDGQRATTRTRAGAGQCLRIRLSDNVRSSDIPSSSGRIGFTL